MHEVLKDFYSNGAIVYIDDTIIYGRQCILDKILSQMVKYNVRLKLNKCLFGMTSIKFLVHIFDINGVKLLDSRVQGINDLSKPTSVKAVRSFIGMANYFREFVKGQSSHMIPLTVLTKKQGAVQDNSGGSGFFRLYQGTFG